MTTFADNILMDGFEARLDRSELILCHPELDHISNGPFSVPLGRLIDRETLGEDGAWGYASSHFHQATLIQKPGGEISQKIEISLLFIKAPSSMVADLKATTQPKVAFRFQTKQRSRSWLVFVHNQSDGFMLYKSYGFTGIANSLRDGLSNVICWGLQKHMSRVSKATPTASQQRPVPTSFVLPSRPAWLDCRG